jgi:predicted solute-binding protein
MNHLMRRALLAGAALLSLTAAGCGDKQDEKTTAATATTADVRGYTNILADADKICAELETSTNAAAAKEDYTEAVRLGDDALAKLKAFDVPAQIEADWNDFLDKAAQVQDVTRQYAAELEAGNTAEAQRIIEDAKALSDSTDAAARKLGLKACAE